MATNIGLRNSHVVSISQKITMGMTSLLENLIDIMNDSKIIFSLTQNFDTKKEIVKRRFHGHTMFQNMTDWIKRK